MMDWVYIESKYRFLKQAWDDAWNDWVDHPNDNERYNELNICKSQYMLFCTDVLEQLMEKNADVLERLKKM